MNPLYRNQLIDLQCKSFIDWSFYNGVIDLKWFNQFIYQLEWTLMVWHITRKLGNKNVKNPANQLTGFYMMANLTFNELINKKIKKFGQ